ncbi:MAG: hypothetical protein C4520_03030 [Candidatus Abyssobacteria bacterium SURF_5]|uniref:Glycosyltransferase RgtA/B/C/D-like domain-containing protein n=1 Tax=Abyssobacteria bacterium (strain SURF_5) TaxID=2093360 RepID=A0A3A4P2R9_ABYX5|nr:MAG: hypothetical protein C4520_03030 [Candidatus Abyssubacteria bacterium SURF_5]
MYVHAFYFNYSTDDAFITFRYVRNMLDGHGLVYNAGERVEGYTNFLWGMLISLPASLGLKIELSAKLLGLFFGAATLVVVTAIAFLWVGPRVPAGYRLLLCLPAFLLAASGPFAMWTLGGLEAVFFTFLLALTTLCYLRSDRPEAKYATGLLLALLTMTRPDGIVFLPATLAHVAIGVGEDRTHDLRRKQILDCIRLIAAFSILYLPYFIWRYSYYGFLLPNTFYAKVGGGPAFLVRGLKYAWQFFSTYGFVPLAAASAFFYARMQQPVEPLKHEDRRIFSYLFLQIAAYLIFIVAVGGDQLVMKRFFVPLLPALYLLTLRGAIELLPSTAGLEQSDAGWRKAVAAAGVISLGITAMPSFGGAEHNRVFKIEKPADSDRKIVGEWLGENVDSEATVALIPAGIVPYFSGLRTIDLVGLNDPNIAHASVPDFGKGEPGHEKYNSGYVLRRRPDLIFLGACRIWPEKLTPEMLLNYYWMYGKLAPGNREILELQEFKDTYSPWAARVDTGYIHFFKRNDFVLPPAEPLRASATG